LVAGYSKSQAFDETLFLDSEARILKCIHFCASVDVRLGGVSRSVIDLVVALHGRSVDVSLAYTHIGSEENSLTAFPEGLIVHDLSSKERFFADATKLIQQFDVVHLHTPWWTQNLRLVEIARRLGKPVFLSSHGMLDDWSMEQKPFKKYLYMKFFGERMIRKCVVHCTAKSEKEQVLKRTSPLAVEVIPLVIDEKYLSGSPEVNTALSRWPFLEDPFSKKLLFLGRVDPKKGVDVAINALASLPSTILCIAGPGEVSYINQLKELATQLGVADRVRWLGSVYNQEKDSLLAACDCMVLPTQQENFGLVLVEGLSMGMHVVTTAGTDIWQEIQHCGGIIAERTPDAFAKAVKSCLAVSTSSSERLDSQRRRLRDWLDPETTVDTYIRMYDIYRKKARY